MCRLIAACVTLSSAAASEKLAWRAAASKALRAFSGKSRRAMLHVTKTYMRCKAMPFVSQGVEEYIFVQRSIILQEISK
jgi:hypothetical protein